MGQRTMYNWIFGDVCPVAEKIEECKEKVPGLHATEVDSKPSFSPKVGLDLPNPSEDQWSGQTPIAEPSKTEVNSDVGLSTQHPRWPTSELVMPRHHTVGSDVDLTHADDLDCNKEVAAREMEEEPFTILYVDRAVPPNSDIANARDCAEGHDIDVKTEAFTRIIRAQATESLYVDRAVSTRSQSVDNRSRKRPREKLADAFNAMSQKRASVLALRYEVQEARTSLRRERETMNSRDAQNIQKLRAAVVNRDFIEQGRLLDLLEDLQRSRDILLPKEDDFEILEDQLNREEWELKELERKLFGRGVDEQISLLDDDEVTWFENNLERGQSSTTTDSELIDDSPPMTRYLSRKADVEMMKEQLIEMEEEHAQLLEDKETRAQLGLNLGEDSQAILEGFDKHRESVLREIMNVEEDVSRLQDALTNKDEIFFSINRFYGYGPEASDQNFTEPLIQGDPFPLDLEDVTADIEPLSRDPLLLTEEERRKNDFITPSDEDAHTGISTPRYVNQWLLHILRRSIPEVERFNSTYELRDVKLSHSQEEIRDMALEWWFKDQSVHDFERSREIAAGTFEHSVKTEPEQLRSQEGEGEREILMLAEPDRQVRGSTGEAAGTPTIIPPVQALVALSLSERPKPHSF